MKITAVDFDTGCYLDYIWYKSGYYKEYEVEINPSQIVEKRFIGRKKIEKYKKVKTTSKFLWVIPVTEYDIITETETTPPLYVYFLSNGDYIWTEQDIEIDYGGNDVRRGGGFIGA